jgi:hypothetical protein
MEKDQSAALEWEHCYYLPNVLADITFNISQVNTFPCHFPGIGYGIVRFHSMAPIKKTCLSTFQHNTVS